MRSSIRRWFLFLLPTTLIVMGFSAPAHAATGLCTDVYRIQAANGYYVAAETDRTDHPAMLRARTPAGALGTWEEYEVWEQIFAGVRFYSFRAHNGKFVDAFESYGEPDKGMLRATAMNNDTNYKRFLMTAAWMNGAFVLMKN